jgi:hypothetical protein
MALADQERFYADVLDRLHSAEDGVERPKLTLNADAQATIQRAISNATARRRGWLGMVELLYALVQDEQGPATDLLARYGASVASLRAELEGAL